MGSIPRVQGVIVKKREKILCLRVLNGKKDVLEVSSEKEDWRGASFPAFEVNVLLGKSFFCLLP